MSRRPDSRPRPRRAAAAAPLLGGVALGALLILAACTATPTPSPTTAAPTTVTASPTSSAAATPSAPVLVPTGTAQENLPLFTAVTATVWVTPENASGRAYIDALVAVGFDRAAMQVTPDQTTIGNPAEAIQFSVRWTDNQCLVGQIGPATGAPVTTVAPVLGSGACLVGNTRPIDW